MNNELENRTFYSLEEILVLEQLDLSKIIPANLVSILEELFSSLYFSDEFSLFDGENLIAQGQFAWEGQLALSFPGFDAFTLSFFSGSAGWTFLNGRIVVGPDAAMSIFHGTIVLKVNRALLKPVKPRPSQEIEDGNIEIEITGDFHIERSDGQWLLDMDVTNQISLPRSAIGTTGIIIEFRGLHVILTGEKKGLGFESAQIDLPPEINGLPDLNLEDGFISPSGFSGTVSAEWVVNTTFIDGSEYIEEDTTEVIASIFTQDFKVAIQSLSIRIGDNRLKEFSLHGVFQFPNGVLDGITNAELSFADNGELLVSLYSRDKSSLITLRKKDLFELEAKSISLHRKSKEISITMSCNFHLTNPSVQQIIPKFEIQGFTLFRPVNGSWNYRIEGATIEVNKSINLFGVARCDINEIGLTNGNDLTFSGGVQILEGLDAEGWVEGLRVPLVPDSDGGLALDGIGLRVVVPKSFEFEGFVVRKQEDNQNFFEGLVDLHIIPIKTGVGAYLKFGKNPNCRFAFLAVRLVLPEPGIPLASLPLYLRHIDGLIGINTIPDAKKIQDFFPLATREPVGLTHGSKWRDECGSHAIALGVGIATANSRLLHISALLGFLYPELVLLIEGKAFVLQDPNPKKTPPFHALVAFERDEPSTLINISIKHEFIKGVMEASGTAEAYFSPATWHLALGQAKPHFPVDRPIGAKVLKLFSASSYLILTPDTWVLGASIGLPKKKYGFSFASVRFEAFMKGAGELHWNPEQVKGYLDLKGAVGFRIFRIGFDLSLKAKVLGMAPDWLVDAILEFFVKFKILWKKFKFGGSIPFHWERRITPPLSQVLAEIVLQHRVSSTSWKPYLLHAFLPEDCADPPSLSSIPDIEPDTLITLTFNYPINDRTGNSFGQQIQGTEHRHKSGDYLFVAELPRREGGERGIELYRMPIDRWGTGEWERFRASPGEDNPNGSESDLSPILYGAWQADKAPDGTKGATHLQLFAQTPFEYNSMVLLGPEDRTSYQQRVTSFDPCNPILVGEPKITDAESSANVEIPYILWEMKSSEELAKSPPSFPSRPVQYLFREDSEFPRTETQLSGSEECVNFFTTRIGRYSADQMVQFGGDPHLLDKKTLFNSKEPIHDVLLWNLNVLGFQNDSWQKTSSILRHPSSLPVYHLYFDKVFSEDGKLIKDFHIRRLSDHDNLFVFLRYPVTQLTLHYRGRFDPSPQPGDWPAIQFRAAYRSTFLEDLLLPNSNESEIQTLIDSSEIGIYKIIADSRDGGFNKVWFSVFAPITIFSICHSRDQSTYLRDKKDQLDNYICSTFSNPPGSNPDRGPMWRNSPELDDQVDVMSLGYVYKLKVRTKQKRKKRDKGRRDDVYCAYFKVPRPPSNLSPYVLQTYPSVEGFPHYRAHEFFIRFHKGYIHHLLGKKDQEFFWKILFNGKILTILPFRDGQDAELQKFQKDLSADRQGWGWGKSTGHILTDEEKIWMEAYNRQATIPISAKWATPDDMIWAYPINPIMLRTDFRSTLRQQKKIPFFQEPRSESGGIRGEPWKITASHLVHNYEVESSDAGGQGELIGSFILTESAFSLPFQLSVWLRAQSEFGRVGIVFASEPELSRYLLLQIDVANQTLTLLRNDNGLTPSRKIWLNRDLVFSENQWIRMVCQVSLIDSELFINFDSFGQNAFSLGTDLSIQDQEASLFAGLYASRSFFGSFDNVEVLSLTRLEQLPRPQSTHHLSFFYEVQRGFPINENNSDSSGREVHRNLTVHRNRSFEEIESTSTGVPQVVRYYAKEKEPIEIYRTAFVSSRYLDLFDHLNSWNRQVLRSEIAGENDQQLLIEGLLKWERLSCSHLLALGEMEALQRSKPLGNASLEDMSQAKKSLREARFDLDAAFEVSARLFGFDLAPRINQFEITVAQNGLGLLIETPEPLDWTRISSGIFKVLAETLVGNPVKPQPAQFLYNSDFTRGILLLRKSKVTLEPFGGGETYEWVIKQNFHLPRYLEWLSGWVTHRREEHRLTLEIPF